MNWLKTSKSELIIAAAIGLIIVLGVKQYQQRKLLEEIEFKALAPVGQWFEVSNISIPDFILGEDPLVVYDRTIRRPFNGTWSSEIKPLNGASDLLPTVCTGSGIAHYEAGEQLDPSVVTFSWLTGTKGCPTKPGRYMGIFNYEVRPDNGYPQKTLTTFTNIFTVLPKGSQLYITPEQVRKLDADPLPPLANVPDANPFKPTSR